VVGGLSISGWRAVAAGAVATLVVGTGLAAAAIPARVGGGAVTSLAPVDRSGHQANGNSLWPAISADGRFVAFVSRASNLVAGDTNGTWDVFVRDRKAQVTRRVSVGPGGQQANGRSWEPAISADGRFVTFESRASNLVVGDTNGSLDVFLRDRKAQVTRRVSVGPGGQQANDDTFSSAPAISADGRFVAFFSLASNLVAGDTNGHEDVFVRDRKAQVTRRVSVGQNGQQANYGSFYPAISGDGRFVAFESGATNLVPHGSDRVNVFVRDRIAQVTRQVSVALGGQDSNSVSFAAAISAHGRFVTFQSAASNLVGGDTNNRQDVFMRDRKAQVTRRVSVGAGGQQANSGSRGPAISADGRFVTFWSFASNLVAGDTNGIQDVFVRDRKLQVTRRVSVGPGGQQTNDESFEPAISADGRFVVFASLASNLVAGDTNDHYDIFVRDRVSQVTRRVSVGSGG
jgi:Tol biopolymer transport system component